MDLGLDLAILFYQNISKYIFKIFELKMQTGLFWVRGKTSDEFLLTGK
jgi:hypothetical protein